MIIAIDFDGTVCEHKWPKVGPTVPHCVNVLKRIAQKHQIMIYTMRDGKELEAAKNWYRENGIPFASANENIDSWSESKKLYAHIYIDDAALGCPLVLTSDRAYVDWVAVEKLLENKGVI